MPFFGDRLYDNGLSVLDTEATHIEITSQESTTYTSATSTHNLATKNFGAGGVAGSPTAGTPNGRQVSTTAVTDGVVGTGGTGSHWAITDRTNSRLLAAGPLAASQVLTLNNVFTLGSFVIRFAAPTAV
jgi:hypothetical protein